MLNEVKFSQFGGMNTVVDSSNQGVSGSRLVRNFLLRPLGALGVPPAWTSFAPGDGAALSLAFLTNIDYMFDTGSALYIQSSDGNWWNATPRQDGTVANVPVTWAGATIGANLVLTAGQVMAFKYSSTLAWKLFASEANLGYATERCPVPPYYSTRYTTAQAFLAGFGPVFTDAQGNTWKIIATNDTGIDAVTI